MSDSVAQEKLNILELSETSFNSYDYLNGFYSSVTDCDAEAFWPWNVIKILHQFSDRFKQKDSKVLEFGGGPVLWASFLFAQYFEEIWFCDYLKKNLQMVQDWIDKKPTAHNWKAFFNSIIQMHDNEQQEASSAAITKTVATNNNDREEQWEEQLRLALREGGLFLCDVNNDESLVSFDFDPPPQFDMIYSSLCLEVCKTVEHFKQTIKRLERLLKPGGLLLVNGVTNKSYYHVGNKIIYSLSISAKQVSQAFEDAGITDNLKFISKPRKPNLKCDDCEGLYTIFAFKPSK